MCKSKRAWQLEKICRLCTNRIIFATTEIGKFSQTCKVSSKVCIFTKTKLHFRFNLDATPLLEARTYSYDQTLLLPQPGGGHAWSLLE